MPNNYEQIILGIFNTHYTDGTKEFEFSRVEIPETAERLDLDRPKNVGDIIYSFRYRNPLPDEILRTAPEGLEWIIEPAGHAKYRFRLSSISRILPRMDLVATKIPDATPELVSANALNDEQALLAKVRYNRLIDIFLGLTTYSLQNHLRTTVTGLGQIEVDELYIGINRNGAQFIIPVQAKGGSDQIGSIQTKQDIACCKEKYSNLVCRAVSTQFMQNDRIVMFELNLIDNDNIGVVSEKHYQLVKASDISGSDLDRYRNT